MWESGHQEGWALKNWCFWAMVLEKTPESPLDCKEIKPVHPKGHQPWISLEGLILKLKLQSFGHLMQRADTLEMTLMLGKFECRRRRGRQRMRWLESITNSMDINLSELQEIVKDREVGRAVVHGVTKSQTWFSNWTKTPKLLTENFHWKQLFFLTKIIILFEIQIPVKWLWFIRLFNFTEVIAAFLVVCHRLYTMDRTAGM